jgi:integrase
VSKKPTLELPPHVQHIVSGGREYFYFQKGRRTKSAGPRHRLPGTPHSVEFWGAYRSFMGSELPTGKAFDDLIAAYKLSPEFTRRSDATQRDYARYLKIISSAWGDLLVASLRPKHVIHLRDAWAETPVAANHLLSVLKTVINWGIPREFSETNPCVYVPKLETDAQGARPWPSWAYELIEKHAREDIRRAVLLARYTGQRQSDVLRMGPDDIEEGGLNVRQQKTGKKLWVPLHRDLIPAMAGWDSSPFVETPRGESYTADRFRAAWTRLMNNTPVGRIRAEGFTFHGLRASSVEKLREAGCGDREIEAITGMSVAMITRYSRFANQKSLAKSAIRRLEGERKRNASGERAGN